MDDLYINNKLMTMKNIFYFIFLTVMLSSCFDKFLTPEPKTLFSNANYWKTEKEVEKAYDELNGLFRSTFSDVTVRLYRQRALPFDEKLASVWKHISNGELEKKWDITSSTLDWEPIYGPIAMAHLIMEHAPEADMTKEKLECYMAQADVIRCYCYYYAALRWGDVPLITSSKESVGEKACTPCPDVLNFIISQLDKCIPVLPWHSQLRRSDGTAIVSKQVVSKGTALILAAYTCAYKGSVYNEPTLLHKAIGYLDELINSGEYFLATDITELIDKVMLGDSPEGIFELSFGISEGMLNGTGSSLAGAAQQWPVVPNATPATRRLILRILNSTVEKLYPEGDMRRLYFKDFEKMKKEDASITQNSAYLNKFTHVKLYADGPQRGTIEGYLDNEILFRLGGAYLLRAELRNKIGNRAGAIADLNIIRQRACAPLYSEAEGDLQKVIVIEIIKELFGEGYDLFYDIERNHLIQEFLPGRFKTFTEADIVNGCYKLPKHLNYFNKNTLARQNSYWVRFSAFKPY